MTESSKVNFYEATNLSNKLIVLIGEVEIIINEFNGILDVMTDDTPDNDFPQDMLEGLIFTGKQKLNGYKIRFDEINSKLANLIKGGESHLSQELIDLTNKNKQIFLDSYARLDKLIKNVASTAIKWEVGSSEVIKALKKRLMRQGKIIESHSNEIAKLMKLIGEMAELVESELHGIKNKIEQESGRIDEIKMETTPAVVFKEFKDDLIRVLENKQNIKEEKMLIKY